MDYGVWSDPRHAVVLRDGGVFRKWFLLKNIYKKLTKKLSLRLRSEAGRRLCMTQIKKRRMPAPQRPSKLTDRRW